MSLNEARKDDSNRESRLRKTFPEEKRIADIVKSDAVAACKKEINEFAQCEKANGLFVIFNCRLQNNAMNECMKRHMTQEHHDNVRLKRAQERAETSNQ
ncbi:hypothetical protein GUITHDRAFT_115776 [Guillardia theta CCMP2712]|uniref:COX assembly mitochondrial protein n=2 Tax=Guillardia theta TaxID=55529 RepID=L1IP19_GUITC|nr:hypothetical protein GUITHDRAFT_115776 [Guillardia theta CCMP2712]EKX38013.1 hypothetical protein GUITHDRAFT_115776 [Guillardia theta CCMP2712]|eukprot:XP_005824993.1 hypothetical protein GUITHDRAFT_115776 [Guillardia theta CCMP2712]